MPSPTVKKWNRPNNLLCVRPDNMGDVLMTTPAFRALKQTFDCRLTLLTSSAGAAIAQLIPEVDDIVTFDVPWVKNDTSHNEEAVVELAAQLKVKSYDAAILFTTYSQNPLPAAMLCYLAGIHPVLGYCRENPYHLIDTWVPDPEPLEMICHEVQRQLDLVKEVGATTTSTSLSLAIPSSTKDQVKQRLTAHGVDLGQPWLVLHTGVSEPKRAYSMAGFSEAARRLVQEGWQIVLTGSTSEKAGVSKLAKAIGNAAKNLAGVFSVEELAAVIALSPILISNNTGPVHIAAAMQTPVVVLYAETNPQHTPWQVPSEVLYFPVPPEARSKNRFLQNFPGPATPQASPGQIVQAVRRLALAHTSRL